ncbi:hypothetical protein EI94DRAFT_1805597 [Lactarius quietus]|nr:hypothetical protein EI94DRAFT_1805597 [Lactarius quietus]
MSSTSLDHGHAVHSDGILKDASEIQWTYNADEALPFPTGMSSHVPAVHQTTCTHHPSRRALEAAEAEAEAEALAHAKCKAPADPNPAHHLTHKLAIDDSDSNSEVEVEAAANDSNSDDSTTTEPGTEPAGDNYELLKAMVVE